MSGTPAVAEFDSVGAPAVHRGQRSRKSISPARGTTSVSGSAAKASGWVEEIWVTCGASVHPLEHRGEPLATPDAHGFQAVARLSALHLPGEGGEDARAGGADGVAKRDAGAAATQGRPTR